MSQGWYGMVLGMQVGTGLSLAGLASKTKQQNRKPTCRIHLDCKRAGQGLDLVLRREQPLGTRRGSKEDLPDPCIDSGRRDTSLEVPPEDEQGNVFFCCSIDAQTQLFSHLHLVAQILKFADFSYFQNLNLEDKMFACCLIYSYH